MRSDLPSQRPINEIVRGNDDGPLMVAKVIQDGEPFRWMYLWPAEQPASVRAFESGLRDEAPT